MKTTIVAICFLCSLCVAAGAQTASVLPNTPAPLQMSDHTQHASQHDMAKESTLLNVSSYSYAQGEVPLADLGSPIYHVPLGDVARACRKEHATAPKAVVVFEKQG